MENIVPNTSLYTLYFYLNTILKSCFYGVVVETFKMKIIYLNYFID